MMSFNSTEKGRVLVGREVMLVQMKLISRGMWDKMMVMMMLMVVVPRRS